MRLPNWSSREVDISCPKCGSEDVKRTNPSIATLLYYPALFVFKHVNFHCFNCSFDWDENYFRIKKEKLKK